MGALVCLAEHFHLALVVLLLLYRRLIVGQSLVHFVAGINDGLHIAALHVLQGQLRNLEVRLEFALCEDGLRELADGIEQKAPGVDDGAAAIVRPAHQPGQRDGGEEGGTGSLHVVVSLLNHMVCHADVGPALQQLCRHAVDHLLRQRVASPLAALDASGRNAHQAAEIVLDALDIALRVHNLCLDVEPRSLHLLYGRGVGFAVLPKRPLRLERSVPERIGLGENLQLAVQYLQQCILLAGDADEVGVDRILVALSLQQRSLRRALPVGDGAERLYLPVHLQRQRIDLCCTAIVEARYASLRSDVERRQVGELGCLERCLALLHGNAGRTQVGVAGQHLLDELLEQRVGEEFAPGERCLSRRRVGNASDIRRDFRLRLIFLVQAAARKHKAHGCDDDDILIMGDLNAYTEETPIQNLIKAGYEEQLVRFDPNAYTYNYYGEKGILDHAMANSTMADQVTGAYAYHINTSGYSSYKYSDHDAVLVGLRLGKSSGEGIDELHVQPAAHKFMHNGQILIEIDGQVYTILGNRVH